MTEKEKPRVLFVCVHNAGRSQMAAAFFNRRAGDRAVAYSAGTRPAEHVHPEVVQVMREVGLDLSAVKPTLLTKDLAEGMAQVITMGCGDECPVMSAPVEDWGLPDPAGRSLSSVRDIRDEIDGRVQRLFAKLGI